MVVVMMKLKFAALNLVIWNKWKIIQKALVTISLNEEAYCVKTEASLTIRSVVSIYLAWKKADIILLTQEQMKNLKDERQMYQY
jgi:hypothetical protein